MITDARPGMQDDKAGADLSPHSISDPSSIGEGAGPLDRAILAWADFQGGPASIRDPHAGVFFLNPLPLPVGMTAQRTGRWRSPPSPSARELLDNPTTRNLRSIVLGVTAFDVLASVTHNLPEFGFICIGLCGFGLLISRPASSRAAAEPKSSHSPSRLSSLAKVRQASKGWFVRISQSLRSSPLKGAEGVNRSAGTSSEKYGTSFQRSGA